MNPDKLYENSYEDSSDSKGNIEAAVETLAQKRIALRTKIN